ncbi:MAG: peptidoglycan bridge formation glycyltransferase FemA/FemB family protein [Chloroflexi bacterium]|nr:peptidoglycan bridge formation glycyltransferase FemA/FemB family protein [Chloroflexota bacterium]
MLADSLFWHRLFSMRGARCATLRRNRAARNGWRMPGNIQTNPVNSLPQEITPAQWTAFVASQPRAHILQLLQWGALKSRFGWGAEPYALADLDGYTCAALVLEKRLPMGLGKMAYVPMGGYATDEFAYDALWFSIRRESNAAFLKVEPGHLAPGEELDMRAMGFRPSPQSIQPPRTIIIDITGEQDVILARMSQSTRRKVRKSLRSEVTYRKGTRKDLLAFCQLMRETGARNNFGVHEAVYYEAVYELFMPSYGALLLAERADELLAAVMVFALGQTAWYLYGASSRTAGSSYASYGIQWSAIRWAKRRGCQSYDMWGVPDYDEAELEAQYQQRSDGLWGVYGFKRGWGGELRRSMGAWDMPFSQLQYGAYRLALKYKGIDAPGMG